MATIRTQGPLLSVFSLFSCTCLAVVCCQSWVSAQVLYRTMLGSVTDSSHAVIPGAIVTAINKDTNQTFEAPVQLSNYPSRLLCGLRHALLRFRTTKYTLNPHTRRTLIECAHEHRPHGFSARHSGS